MTTGVILTSVACGSFHNPSAITMPEERRSWFMETHPELSNTPEMKNAILAGQVTIGMNTDQVIASIGTADARNRTVTQFGTHEQWVYAGGFVLAALGVRTEPSPTTCTSRMTP